MNEVFADTSGWASYFVRTEPFHADAAKLMREWHTKKIRIITSNYILTELVALFTSPLRIPRTEQIRVIETIRTSDWVEIVHINQTLHEESWVLLKERQDKTWSLLMENSGFCPVGTSENSPAIHCRETGSPSHFMSRRDN
jgi:predicted nucleic acid-binding protein